MLVAVLLRWLISANESVWVGGGETLTLEGRGEVDSKINTGLVADGQNWEEVESK